MKLITPLYVEKLYLLLTISCLFTFNIQSHGGVLYTERELWAVGNLWKQTQCQWKAEQLRHKNRMNEIDTSPMPNKKKDFFRQKEARLHRAESQALAGKRNQVHNVLIDEANARAGRGKQSVSDRIEASLGTKIDDPAHSGMKSDLDAQGGALTTKKVKETLKDMGLDDIKVNDRAGTLEIGDDFELVVHKGGIKPEVGTEFHHIRNQVDARNPEVFMSERMRNRTAGTKQVGTDYVEVQDHLKKANYGHNASNKQLVDNPDHMQSMVKSTNKTLDMGDVSKDELQAILTRNGIKDTPEDFLKKLDSIKQRKGKIKDPVEAGRIREASKDIMAKAEKKAYARTKDEISVKKKQLQAAEDSLKKVKAMSDNPETAARRKKLEADLEARAKSIREELIDSNSKMKASKAANDELRARGAKQQELMAKKLKATEESLKKLKSMSDNPDTAARRKKLKADLEARAKSIREQMIDPNKKITRGTHPDAPESNLGKTKTDPDLGKKPPKVSVDDAPDIKTRIKNKATKAFDVFGNVMDIADIGNACKKLEEYQEGKAELKDVIRSVVDMTPVGGLIGTSEKLGTTADDYYNASKDIKKANETNMSAYLTQWELALRRANLSKEDARKYVASAVLAGNLDALEAKAVELRLKGKSIKSPKLVVEDGPAPDGGSWYMWENTKELGYGMYEGAKTGGTYIVTAPYRTVMAFGERELTEATMDYNNKTAESDMKTRLFRSLLDAGIDSKDALRAVQYGGSQLKKVAAEARKNLQEKRELELQIEAERKAFQERVNACLQKITDLRFMPLSLKTDPSSPIPIPQGSSPDDVMELTVQFDQDLASALDNIRSEINSITGQKPSITATYQCSLKSAKETQPGTWDVTLPAKPDLYPVSAAVTIRISGLTGDFTEMSRTIRRDIRSGVQLKLATESITLSQESYQFYDGDYETITATLKGAQQGASYFYQWTVGDKSSLTQQPQYDYNAELDGAESKTETLKVVLADRLTGSVLDEDSASITISPLKGTQVLINERNSRKHKFIWKKITCIDLHAYTRNEAYSKQKEIMQFMREQRARGDYIEGQSRPPKVLYIYGLQHGPYTEYDYDTGTMLEQNGHYRNGKKHGKWVRYETRRAESIGSVTDVTHYVDGKKHGNSKGYIDGRLYADTNWKNGVEHGLHKYFSRRAPQNPSTLIEYNQGKRVRGYRWIGDPNLGFDRELNKYRPCIYYSKTWYGSDSGKPTERVTVWTD